MDRKAFNDLSDQISECYRNLPRDGFHGPYAEKLREILSDRNLTERLGADASKVFSSKIVDTGVFSMAHGSEKKYYKPKETLLHCFIHRSYGRNFSSDGAFTLELIDRCSETDILKRSMDGYLPLECAVHYNSTEVALKLLEALPVKDVKSVSKKIIKDAEENRNSVLLEAIQSKISNQSALPRQRSVLDVKTSVVPVFADPRKMIEDAMASGNSSDAWEVGDKLLNSCTDFFNRVNEEGAKSLARGLEANADLDVLTKRISQTKKHLEKITENPKSVSLPNGVLKPVLDFVYDILPVLDPENNVKRDFKNIQKSIQDSISSSRSVIKAYEDLQRAHPAIREQLLDLEIALEEAIIKIDEEVAVVGTLDDHQVRTKLRLREAFDTIRAEAQSKSHTVYLNASVAENSLDAENSFVKSISTLRTALDATITNSSLMISNFKASSAGRLSEGSKATIKDQVQEAQYQLYKMEELNRMQGLVTQHAQQRISAARGDEPQAGALLPVKRQFV